MIEEESLRTCHKLKEPKEMRQVNGVQEVRLGFRSEKYQSGETGKIQVVSQSKIFISLKYSINVVSWFLSFFYCFKAVNIREKV